MRPKLKEELGRLVEAASVVHVHGIWQEHCSASVVQSRQYKKPLIVSAHGMLDSWALLNKGWKKNLYLAVRHRRELQSAACFRALTRDEAEDYRRAGFRGIIAVIPNGVAIPARRSADEFFQRYPALKRKRLLLFLGRLHYKKGINTLAEAWGNLCGRFPDAHLVLAGPNSEESKKSLVQTVQRLRIESRVTFTGILTGSLKWSALAAAHVFVLPSYSEGFSVAALEAMAAARPVILSKQCHFPEVMETGCGWIIDPEIEPLESALTECLSSSPAVMQALGANAEHLARTRYDWSHIASQMADVCDWLRGGKMPQSVEILC